MEPFRLEKVEISIASKTIFKWNTKVEICCADVCNSDIYVGLSDGSVAHYTLNHQLDFQIVNQVSITNQPLESLQVVYSESKILVQSDSTLYILDTLLKTIASIKGITCFTANRLVQSPLDVTVSKPKSIVTYSLDTKVVPKKQFMVEGCQALCQYDTTICFADKNMYHLYTNHTIPLFPFEGVPLLLPISNTEFMLVTNSAQGFGIGIFVSQKGDPVRGTLQWPVIPTMVGFVAPYIVALLGNVTIQIHNLETLTLVQSIPIPTLEIPRFMTTVSFQMDTNGGSVQFVIGCPNEMFVILMLPWDVQLDQLFHDDKVEEGLGLLEQMKHDEHSEEQWNKRRGFYKKAGLHFISTGKFERALIYLQKCRLEPIELIQLYPSIKYPMEAKPVETVDDIIAKVGNENSRDTLKMASEQLLIEYLMYCRTNRVEQDDPNLVDNCLVQILAQCKQTELLKSVVCEENTCRPELVVDPLLLNGFYYFASLIFKLTGQHTQALDIWIQLCSGEKTDTQFPGIPVIVDFLKCLTDKETVKKYAAWVLSRDPTRGVQIFINRNDDIFVHEEVLDFLESFGGVAKRTFLEYLVRKESNTMFKTNLAILYLDEIKRLAIGDMIHELTNLYQVYDTRSQLRFVDFLERRGDPLCRARVRFCKFVSQFEIDVEAVLNIIRESENELIIEEIALLTQVSSTKQIREHDQVLNLYVHELNDTISAVEYCLKQESKDFLKKLVGLYLAKSKYDHTKDLLNLIQSHMDYFSFYEVLGQLPARWSMALIAPLALSNNQHVKGQLNESTLRLKLLKSYQTKVYSINMDSKPIIVQTES